MCDTAVNWRLLKTLPPFYGKKQTFSTRILKTHSTPMKSKASEHIFFASNIICHLSSHWAFCPICEGRMPPVPGPGSPRADTNPSTEPRRESHVQVRGRALRTGGGWLGYGSAPPQMFMGTMWLREGSLRIIRLQIKERHTIIYVHLHRISPSFHFTTIVFDICFSSEDPSGDIREITI